MKRAIGFAILTIVIIAGGMAIRGRFVGTAAATKTQYKVAKAARGEVKKTVSATGTLKPWTTVDIKSKAGGRVERLRVDVGSAVKKNDIIAEIDPSDTLLSVDTARADIDSANAREDQSRRSWQLQIQQSELAVANAQLSLRSAKASLSAAKARLETSRRQRDNQPEITSATIAGAQANYENAVKQLNELRDATLPQELAAARASLEQAEANRKNAFANLNRQRALMEKGFVSQQAVDQAEANYEGAAAQASTARRKMETIDKEHQATEDAMLARLRQAEAQLKTAKAGSIDVDLRKIAFSEQQAAVSQSEQQVATATKNLQLAIANRANNQIRYNDILQARATKARAVASFSNAKKTLDQTVVRAPSEGVVLTKYVEEGTIITSGLSLSSTGTNIIQLGDVTRMYVDVVVDETDIASVEEGQTVDVSVEAYSGIPFSGKVTRIDPQAMVESNVTTIHVRVEVDNSEPSFRLLKPGMNATCEFVVDKKDDVVNVPTDAVHTDDNGSYVEIAEGGTHAPPDPKTGDVAGEDVFVDVKVTRRAIEVGTEGNETTEVATGLKDGEPIVVQKIEPTPQTTTSPFASGGPGGGMRGGRMR